MVALLIEAFIAKASFPPVTRSNTGRGIWRETAFVTLVLRTNPGLQILEDYEQIAKRLECEQRKRGIRYRMCNVCYISAYGVFPHIRKDFKAKSSIPRSEIRGFFIL
jgi:hypothetical protein